MSANGAIQGDYASLSGKIHTLVIDKTLSIGGAAADAKATGDELNAVRSEFDGIDLKVMAAESAAKQAQTSANNAESALTKTYKREEVLTDATKALFGLDASKVPKDVFERIGTGFSRFEAGSYVGTGENTKSLTFNFAPKFVFVYYSNMGSKSGWNPSEVGIYPCFKEDGSLCFAGVREDMNKTSMETTLSGTTLTWTDTKYNTYWDADSEEEYPTADCVLNASGCKYCYIAIG